MVDIGILSSRGSNAIPYFLKILQKYLKNGHILTSQSKMPYILIPTQIENIDSKLNPNQDGLEFNFISKGIYYIQNPETENEIRLFYNMLNPESLEKNLRNKLNEQDKEILHESKIFFIEFEDYISSCKNNIVFISAAMPVEPQIAPLIKFNFKFKRYQFYLTEWEHISQSRDSMPIISLIDIIKKIALKYHLQIESEIIVLKLSHSEFTDDNQIPLQFLFQSMGDNFTISNKSKKEFIFQIISLHDTQVGSTTLFQSFQAQQFQSNVKPTRGIDIHVLKYQINEYNFIFQIFDIAGDPRWQFLAENFLAHAKAAFFLIDLSNPQSIDTLRPHLERLERDYAKLPIIVLGTKSDLQNIEQEYNLPDWLVECQQIIGYIKLTSQSPDSLKQAFNILIKKIMKNFLYPIELGHNPDMLYFNMKLSEYPLIASLSNQAELLIYNYNYDVINYFRDYFEDKHQFTFDMNEYISDLLKIKDLVIQAYGINVLKYLKLSNAQILKLLNHIQDFYEFHQYLLLEIIWFHFFYKFGSQTQGSTIFSNDKIQLSHFMIDFFFELNKQATPFENNIPFCLLLIDIIILLESKSDKIKQILTEFMIDGIEIIQESAFKAYQILFDKTCMYQSRSSFLSSMPQIQREELLNKKIKQKIQNSNLCIQINSVQNIAAFQDLNYIRLLIPLFIFFGDENRLAVSKALMLMAPSRFEDPTYPAILNEFSETEREYMISIAQKGLFDINYEKRLSSIKLLADIGEKGVQETIIIALNDPKESIRLIAVKALAKPKNTAAIVPLFICYINSLSPILNEEIISAFLTVDPQRFIDRSLSLVIKQFTPTEKSEIINQITFTIPKIQDEAKKLKFIETCRYFPEVKVVKTLFKHIKEPTLRIQQAIRKTINEILLELSISQTCDEELLNTLLQVFDESILMNRIEIDIENFLKKIPWIFILKGLLFEKVPNTRKINLIFAHWNPINLPLFYNLAKKDHYDIFQQFLRHIHSTQIDFNTFHAYLLLSYPFSFDHLTEFINKVANQVSNFQLTQLYRLSAALSANNQFKIQNSQIDHFLLL